MLSLALGREDLAATRFAISPMEDVVASLQRRRGRGTYPVTQPWEAEVDDRLAAMDTGLLDLLISPRGWAPDFLSPFPHGPVTSLETELASLVATPPAQVRTDLEAAYAGQPLPAGLDRRLADPARLLGDIADALATYWDLALADLWPRMRSVLEADIAHWSHRLTAAGLAAMFADLHPTVSWDGRVLRVDVAQDLELEVDVAGRRLPLVPSVFARWPLINISADLPPVLVYPARGAALVWDDTPPATAQLAALLGRGRADVLAALSVPRATVDLASVLGVTPSAVSQQLRVLAGSGLVVGIRQGRRVVYRRTELGDDLASVTAGTPS